MSRLASYKSKRQFDRSPEPSARIKKPKQELVFVIHKHAASHLHYDLRLEHRGVLKCWAVPKGMPKNAQEKRLAIMTEDHPYEYKDFAGIIPAGNYGAGSVEIWDEGSYLVPGATSIKEAQALITAALKKGHLRFILQGKRLAGEFSLIRTEGNNAPNAWLLLKVERKAATAINKPQPMPKQIKPMLAHLIDKPFDHKNWLFEIKLDGYRTIALVNTGNVKLISRNNKSFNTLFPDIVKTIKKYIKKDVIFDGEVLVLDEQGRSRFQLLQEYIPKVTKNLFYYVFDLLYYDGQDLRGQPLIERKEKLEMLLAPLKNTSIRYSDHVLERGKAFFKQAQKLALEGIIAKNILSTYQEGRSSDWLKIKTSLRQEAVIAGFTPPKGHRKGIGALLLGVYVDDKLSYIGKVGTGFSEQALKELAKKLKTLIRKSNYFSNLPKNLGELIFVKPTLVCEVSFSEWTKDGRMRHPVYIGLRVDKEASSVHKEISS